jgi:hypothetical protein
MQCANLQMLRVHGPIHGRWLVNEDKSPNETSMTSPRRRDADAQTWHGCQRLSDGAKYALW